MYFDLNIEEWEFENNYEDIYFSASLFIQCKN